MTTILGSRFAPGLAACLAAAVLVAMPNGGAMAGPLPSATAFIPVVSEVAGSLVWQVATADKKKAVVVTKPRVIVTKPAVIVTKPKAVVVKPRVIVTKPKVLDVKPKVVVTPKLLPGKKTFDVKPALLPGAGKKVVLPGSPKVIGTPKAVFLPGKLKVGPGQIVPAKPAVFPVIKVGNKVAPLYKGQKYIWIGGYKKLFIPIVALGVVAIGTSYYYPDAYVALGQPYCSGITPDGCRLNYQLVALDGGGTAAQCVQYCPRPSVTIRPAQVVEMPPPPPPLQAVAAAPPQGGAPAPQGGSGCEVMVFAEPNFAGAGVPATEDQPLLGESGWLNQIASIQVQAGVWDFYADEQYQGGAMRMQPGNYPTLDPEWTKNIGSFLCVQPG